MYTRVHPCAHTTCTHRDTPWLIHHRWVHPSYTHHRQRHAHPLKWWERKHTHMWQKCHAKATVKGRSGAWKPSPGGSPLCDASSLRKAAVEQEPGQGRATWASGWGSTVSRLPRNNASVCSSLLQTVVLRERVESGE